MGDCATDQARSIGVEFRDSRNGQGHVDDSEGLRQESAQPALGFRDHPLESVIYKEHSR